MKNINRRDFLKYSGGGLAAIVIGSQMPGLSNQAHAAVSALDITITDTIKEMVTHNAINTAECYYWVFKEARLPADCPGPIIYAHTGDTVNITVHNTLDEPHAFYIPGMFDSGPIQPGDTFIGAFTATKGGTHLYYDNLNEPVNRVMGLHGCLIVQPLVPVAGHKLTPYDNPTAQVQLLFDEFGSAAHWPGLGWADENPATLTTGSRQGVWLLSQSSPNLFAEVGDYPPGQDFPAEEFVQRFRRDAFSHNSHDLSIASDIPQYFTMGGQSGHFCHNNPVSVPMARVGEPYLLRVLNAGLMAHSMHIHCNHFYILSVDGVVQGAPVGNIPSGATLLRPGLIWVDTFTANPWGVSSHKYDLILPFMRPPDVPNVRGIGRGGCPDAGSATIAGGTTWPPYEEFDRAMGKTILVRQSPLCYPAHDHSEPSQTSQGGNYNCGVIGGQYIIGDLNVALPTYPNPFLGGNLPPQTFPMDEDFAMMIFREDGTITYGCNEAEVNGIQQDCRDSGLRSQDDRPDFPPV
ncbi:MAG: multicopper oxidase domain-containing protein [Nitrospirae bacterium]|nr:multicopper oxidase domain-containing protein [Nitrospirota bacterium]